MAHGQKETARLIEERTYTFEPEADAEGNTLSQTSTAIRGKSTIETVTTYESDDFGRTIKDDTVTRKQQDGKLRRYGKRNIRT